MQSIDTDFNQVWDDIQHLQKHGIWPDSIIPKWAKKISDEIGVPAASSTVLMMAYEYVASSAMDALKQQNSYVGILQKPSVFCSTCGNRRGPRCPVKCDEYH